MALTRGPQSLFPCTRCLIFHNDQGNLMVVAALRMVDGMKGIVEEAQTQDTGKDKEELLKGNGLRDVDVRLSPFFIFILSKYS